MKVNLDRLAKIYEGRGVSFHPSPEFIEFLKEEVERRGWYEKLCGFCGNILKIGISEEKRENLRSKLDFCNLKIEPYSIYSTFILGVVFTILLMLLASLSYYFISPAPKLGSLMIYIILIFVSGFGFSYYLLVYPDRLIKRIRVEASSEIVLTILYMAIGLKHVPNLENATTFAAINLPGVLGKDLRKLLWDIHVGRYVNIEDGLEDFSRKWKVENKEFSQAVDLLRISLLQPVGREDPIDRAVQLILESNTEKMKSYSRELKNPITMINALGILLPVITLVLFPVVTIFLPNVIKPYILVAIYDVLLPFMVFWLMNDTLQKRPYGFYVADVTKHPKASNSGNFAFSINEKKMQIPLLPISLLIGAVISLPGILGLMSAEKGSMTTRLFSGLSVFWGVVIGTVFYTFFSSTRNKGIKQEVEETEREFGEAMFLLGTVLGSGQPLETCLEKVNKRVKDQKISNLFSRILYTIRHMGVTLKEAIFNENFGVVRYYPSQLIRNTLKIMVESMNRGLVVTASTLMAISQYLKNMKQVDEYLKELLEETTSSMKLMSLFMVPLSAGVVVGMSSLLIMILQFVAKLLSQLPILEETGELPFISGFSIQNIMPIEVFLLVVGIYMIEVLISLSIFTVQLERGNDWIEIQYSIGTSLLRGGIIFTVVLLIIYFLFGGLIPLG